MKVFKSRAEAEAEGLIVRLGGPPASAYRQKPVKNSERISLKYVGEVRSPLEAQLAAVIESVEWGGNGGDCPQCGAYRYHRGHVEKHAPDCKLSLALAAFRGDTP